MTTKIDKMDWLDKVRRGGRVHRYHAMLTHKIDSVAQHSFGVAMLVLAITDFNPSPELMKAALFHDLAEQVTGDVPQFAKKNNPELKAILDKMENDFNIKYGFNTGLTEDEKVILKWADILELMFFVREERLLGNKHADEIWHNAVKICINLKPVTEALKIFHALCEEEM